MRCAAGFKSRLAHDAGDGRVRALARGAAGAVGDRDESRLQRLEPLDRRPQRAPPSSPSWAGRTRRRRRCRRRRPGGSCARGCSPSGGLAPGHAQMSCAAIAAAAAGCSASHSETVSFAVPTLPLGREVALLDRLEAGILPSIARPARAQSPAARARTPRAGTPAHAARNRRSAAGRPAPARAPPRGSAARGSREEVQHLVHHDRVGDAGRRSDRCVDVAVAHLRAGQVARARACCGRRRAWPG